MKMNPANSSISRSKLVLIAGLLALSTILFVVGVAMEQGWGKPSTTAHLEGSDEAGETQSQPATAVATPHTEQVRESAETKEHQAAEMHQEAGTTGLVQSHEEAEGNTLVGLSLESPWMITVVALVSLLLIVAMFRFGRSILILALLFTILALVFDIRELFYQGQSKIWWLAMAVVITRIITAIVTFLVLRERPIVRSSPS